MTPEELCKEVHRLLSQLPAFREPRQIPFDNGLYFFYEEGQASPHGKDGRIVRIGNHPKSDNGLKRRLMLHYSGNKNSSVFRKFLGGAILRRIDSSHPCLLPAPGKGHWEKQGSYPCEKCRPTEAEVSALLRSSFRFRCVEVRDKNIRNMLEKKLVATVSLCSRCKPSEQWLGLYTYSDNVRKSGLWNSNYVFNQHFIMDEQDIKTLRDLVTATLRKLENYRVL